ncbi:MCE family protein [Mycolicibacterium phlei]|uniref:MCE family protein n=1 Tax=Mycolicibacterium phlei TaxID=1771 RepID=UPI000315FB89|nr:MCE family protein [Mycolicibacterium phlei]
MRSFSERNVSVIGIAGLVGVLGVCAVALNLQNLPLIDQGKSYIAEFEDAGGLFAGADVEVSGFPAGRVSNIDLEGDRVVITFSVDKDIHIGDRSEARIRAKSLLGTKVLEVLPRGEQPLDGTIPLSRTTSPYQLPDALGDLAATIGEIETEQVSASLQTLADTFADTPEELQRAVQGVGRIAQTLNERDANLRKLLDNAAKSSGVLAERTDQIVTLVHQTNALLAELRLQSAALDEVWHSVSAAARELKAFIEENRTQLKPALDKLNGVLTIIDDRRDRVQQAIAGLHTYAVSLGESLGSGPFFKAYLANLLPGQFVQPFVEAAFSDLGLDPAVLPPSQLSDPQTGQPATPALPMPHPRTGQGGEPHLSVPDAITGKPGDPRYPYREPEPAPAPGGPPPGPPAPPPGPAADTGTESTGGDE